MKHDPKHEGTRVMSVNLTNPAISKATREAKEARKRMELIDAKQAGLRLRIHPTGSRVWGLACRDRYGAMRSFTIGPYPDHGIAEARDEAQRLRIAVRDGADPVKAASRDRAIGKGARAGVGTLQAVLDAYASAAAKKSFSHSRLRVERVFKTLLDKPIATMRASDLQLLADRYAARPSADFALRTLRPVLIWAAKRDLCDLSLAALEAKQPKKRQRYLDAEEIGAILNVLRVKPLTSHKAALIFMMHTACRLDEAVSLTWKEINLETGTLRLPHPRTKSENEHLLELPTQVIAILKSIKPEKAKPDNFVFPNENGNKLGNWDRATKSIQRKSNTKNWHRHDLRRTAATQLGQYGLDPHIIEAMLNHTEIHSALAITYNQARYRPQVALALQKLADIYEAMQLMAEEQAKKQTT